MAKWTIHEMQGIVSLQLKPLLMICVLCFRGLFGSGGARHCVSTDLTTKNGWHWQYFPIFAIQTNQTYIEKQIIVN